MTKEEAVLICKEKGYSAYGNKGQRIEKTACIQEFEPCTPRLAFNSCTIDDIGCPKCLEKLKIC